MFEQGIAELQKANYAAAEINFKRAIRPDVDSTSALAYLAASFAAAGRDGEAAGAWQTALDRWQRSAADLRVARPTRWCGSATTRPRDRSSRKRSGRWPSDTRFARTLALSYATLGKGRDAIRVLDRYIADGRREPDLLFLMVEWLFQVHSSRAVVINRAADLAMARNYAAEYAKANGPKQALVQQWVEFLANEKP